MSIFFSPDEPKYFDEHSGKMFRLNSKKNSNFSHEKNNTLFSTQKSKSIISECSDLKNIRLTYDNFLVLFNSFKKKNSFVIQNPALVTSFSNLKKSFDPFILYCSRYFNSSINTRKIGRFSPIIEYSIKLLKDWSNIIIFINKISEKSYFSHLEKIEHNFELLLDNISSLSKSSLKKTYFSNAFQALEVNLMNKIQKLKNSIQSFFSEMNKNYNLEYLFEGIKEDISYLTRQINDNILGIIPSHLTSTPEIVRLKTNIKTSCCDILTIFESSYRFPIEISKLLKKMNNFDLEIRNLLNKLQINFRIDVTPKEPIVDISFEEEDQNQFLERTINIQPSIQEPFFIEIPESKISVKRSVSRFNSTLPKPKPKILNSQTNKPLSSRRSKTSLKDINKLQINP